jgi:hypothetical protein
MPELGIHTLGQDDLLAAQQMAQELNKSGVDVNEVHKALRFLSSHKNGPRFFLFLRAIQQKGGVVVRSQQTLAYYDAIHQACERHLRPHRDDPERMAQILGWAVRLMPYYRLEPHLTRPPAPQMTPAQPTVGAASQPAAQPAQAAPTPPAAAARPARLEDLKPGMSLRGRVVGIKPFGAFVDIGVKINGLIHISKLRAGFVQRVEDVVNLGDEVTVWVEQVDLAQKRISLTLIAPRAAGAGTRR